MKPWDIDSDERAYSLCQHEQCLERKEETTSYRTGKARMALTAIRASQRCASRNSRHLPQGGRQRVRPPGPWGRRAPAKATTDPADSKAANEGTTDFSPPI